MKTNKGPFTQPFRMRNAQTDTNQWKWDRYETPVDPKQSLAMLIHKIYFHVPRPQGKKGDNNVAIILSSEDCGKNKSCEPENPNFIAEGELSGNLNRADEIKKTLWDFNPPLLYTHPQIYIATISTGQEKPRIGNAIVFFTLEKVEKTNFPQLNKLPCTTCNEQGYIFCFDYGTEKCLSCCPQLKASSICEKGDKNE
jgi:hypothetical protein